MAFKGTAGKSCCGASMSKYDVEVEARLKKLEATVSDVVAMVSALEKHSHDTPAAGDTSQRLDDVERLIRDSGLV